MLFKLNKLKSMENLVLGKPLQVQAHNMNKLAIV